MSVKTRIAVYKINNGKSEFEYAFYRRIDNEYTMIMNKGLELFPDLESKDLNVFLHGNTYILAHVVRENGFVDLKPLLSGICNTVIFHPNGNVTYKDFAIVRSGKLGTTDMYEYSIKIMDQVNAVLGLQIPVFNDLNAALDYIDKNESIIICK